MPSASSSFGKGENTLPLSKRSSPKTEQDDVREPVELIARPMEERPDESVPAPLSLKSRLISSASLLGRYPLAVLIIGVPLLLTIIYEVFIASDIYVSEAHFVVKSKAMASSTASLSSSSSLSALSSMSQTNDYTQAVIDYLSSRSAIEVMIKKDGLLEVTSRPEGDFFARFPHFWSRGIIRISLPGA